MQRIAREVINRIGYTKSEYMFEGNSCGVFSAIHEQSADINRGVERDSSAFFKRRGNEVLEMWKLNGIDHEQCVQRIRESNRKIPIDKLYMDAAFSDYEYHTLKYEINCEQIHFAQAAPEEFRKDYANMNAGKRRSACFFMNCDVKSMSEPCPA